MKEIVVISGKGGTGKTVLCASFAALADNAAVADCDVDAANMHLLLDPDVQETHAFYGNKTARIITENCTSCRECLDTCRFDAVISRNGEMAIDPLSCEGCQVCYHVCPEGAIVMEETLSGEWYESRTKYGEFVHARLGIAQENSGKLVTEVRKRARELAEHNSRDLILIDGPPGIGCPLIASLSGTSLALVVTEPTLSGMHDMKRVIETARHFKTQTACCINKFDLNPKNSAKIAAWCQENHIPMLGKIPFDEKIILSMVKGIPFVEMTRNKAADMIKKIWTQLNRLLDKEASIHEN